MMRMMWSWQNQNCRIFVDIKNSRRNQDELFPPRHLRTFWRSLDMLEDHHWICYSAIPWWEWLQNWTRWSSQNLHSEGKGKAFAWNAGCWRHHMGRKRCYWLGLILYGSRKRRPPCQLRSLLGAVANVSNLLGNASVAVAGGRKWCIFDFHCDVEFEIKDSSIDDIVAYGIIRLPDVNSGNYSDFETLPGKCSPTHVLKYGYYLCIFLK